MEGKYTAISNDNSNISESVVAEAIVRLSVADLQREHDKAEAQLALLDADPSIIPPQREGDILRESLGYKLYDMAWTVIRYG